MVTVYYYTSWYPVFIYTQIENSWTTLPMSKIENRYHWMQITLPQLNEFVFTDGMNYWDNPIDSQNYQISGTGVYAVYHGRVIQINTKQSHLLLITDLDNTLIGWSRDAKNSLKKFNNFWISNHYFNGSKLVYNTGRSFDGYIDIFQRGLELLDPDLLIISVGSNAYTINPNNGEYENREDYNSFLQKENWDSFIINRLLLYEFKWLKLPGFIHIFPGKIILKSSVEDMSANFSRFKEFLRNKGNHERCEKVINARAILSRDGEDYMIDIVPLEGGKKLGVLFAQEIFEFRDEETLVAGDSENDIQMFRGNQWGVCVANSQGELVSWLQKRNRINKYKSECQYADAIIEAALKISC